MGIRAQLDKIPPGKTVILDFSDCHFVDHTVVERLEDFEGEYEREGGRVEKTGLAHLHHATDEPLSALVKAA